MTTYEVRAKRAVGSDMWELHIPTVGVTQTDDLDRAEAVAVDYISLLSDIHPSAVRVTVVVEDGAPVTGQEEK